MEMRRGCSVARRARPVAITSHALRAGRGGSGAFCPLPFPRARAGPAGCVSSAAPRFAFRRSARLRGCAPVPKIPPNPRRRGAAKRAGEPRRKRAPRGANEPTNPIPRRRNARGIGGRRARARAAHAAVTRTGAVATRARKCVQMSNRRNLARRMYARLKIAPARAAWPEGDQVEARYSWRLSAPPPVCLGVGAVNRVWVLEHRWYCVCTCRRACAWACVWARVRPGTGPGSTAECARGTGSIRGGAGRDPV